MTEEPLILHLGVYKTATTSLQRLLHHQRRALADAGWDVYAGTFDRMYDVIRLLHDYLRGGDDLHAARLALMQILSRDAPRKFVSEEMLLGDMQAGPNLYGGQLSRFISVLESLRLPPCHVIFVVRRLDRLLESFYLHNYAVGHTHVSISEFYTNLDLSCLSWNEILERLRISPAVGRLSVLPYELIQTAPEQYAGAFFEASGIRHILSTLDLPRDNPSITTTGYRLLQALHREAIPDDVKVGIIKCMENWLRQAPGEAPDSLGEMRHDLMRAWADDTHALFARWLPDAPREVLSYYLRED